MSSGRAVDVLLRRGRCGRRSCLRLAGGVLGRAASGPGERESEQCAAYCVALLTSSWGSSAPAAARSLVMNADSRLRRATGEENMLCATT